MLRFDLPDDATEEQIERFLLTLDEGARDGVRRMLLAGAGEAEILDYIESTASVVSEEESAGFEQEEEPVT